MRRTGCILILLIFVSCSGGTDTDESLQPGNESVDLPEHLQGLENLTVYSEDTSPGYTITLTEEAIFGSTDDLYVVVGGPLGELVEVDDQARVFIPDRRQRVFHVYNPDGSHLAQFGRDGSGPGEFRSQREMDLYGNRFYVNDNNLQRISVFSTDDYSLLHMILMDSGNWSHIEDLEGSFRSDFYVRGNDQILINIAEGFRMDNAWQEKTDRFYRMNMEGEIISDEIFSHQAVMHLAEGTSWGFTFPFFRESVTVVADDGHIYSAWTEDVAIKVYDADGNYESAFYYPLEKRPFDQVGFMDGIEERADEIPMLQFRVDAAERLELPDTWPAIKSMKVDDENRLWISLVTDDESDSYRWVLSDTGELLAQFSWPADRSIEVIKDNFVYAFQRDEVGDGWIIKYRIELTEQ